MMASGISRVARVLRLFDPKAIGAVGWLGAHRLQGLAGFVWSGRPVARQARAEIHIGRCCSACHSCSASACGCSRGGGPGLNTALACICTTEPFCAHRQGNFWIADWPDVDTQFMTSFGKLNARSTMLQKSVHMKEKARRDRADGAPYSGGHYCTRCTPSRLAHITCISSSTRFGDKTEHSCTRYPMPSSFP
jgi:hypothetical protein